MEALPKKWAKISVAKSYRSGGVDNWLLSGLENRRSGNWVAGSNPVSSALLKKKCHEKSK